MKINIVLAGTPCFSVPIFEEIIKNTRIFNVIYVVTQPDKKQGRGMKKQKSPVKKLAEKYGLKVLQPEKINEIYETLKLEKIDFFLTCAYGQYVPEKILQLPQKFSLNIHGSVLPKYRGASPLQYSLLNNDKKVGVCLTEMTKEMDSGQVFFTIEKPLLENWVLDDLIKNVSFWVSEKISSWLVKIYEGNYLTYFQNPDQVSYAPKINKKEAEVFLTDKIDLIQKKVKAFSSNPGAFIFIKNKRIKLFRVAKFYKKGMLEIDFLDGKLAFSEFQFEGKKKVKF